MAKRKTELGLGRGLNALLGDPELPAQGEGSVALPISQVEPGLNQPRKRFEQGALDDLAESIRVHGIIQPLTVRRLASGYYQIIAGERRYRAAIMAGLTTVPAYIRTANDTELTEMALIENIQREDLNAIEIALTFKKLIEQYDLTQERLSERIGKKRTTIANFLRLLRLPAEVQLGLRDKRIDMGHARALLSIDDPKLQLRLYEEILRHGLSVRKVEELAKKYQQAALEGKTPADESKRLSNNDYDILKNHLSQRFSTPVKLTCDASGKGKISFSFRDEAELERLIAIFDTAKQ